MPTSSPAVNAAGLRRNVAAVSSNPGRVHPERVARGKTNGIWASQNSTNSRRDLFFLHWLATPLVPDKTGQEPAPRPMLIPMAISRCSPKQCIFRLFSSSRISHYTGKLRSYLWSEDMSSGSYPFYSNSSPLRRHGPNCHPPNNGRTPFSAVSEPLAVVVSGKGGNRSERNS